MKKVLSMKVILQNISPIQNGQCNLVLAIYSIDVNRKFSINEGGIGTQVIQLS